jgi:hypothetical protein
VLSQTASKNAFTAFCLLETIFLISRKMYLNSFGYRFQFEVMNPIAKIEVLGWIGEALHVVLFEFEIQACKNRSTGSIY